MTHALAASIESHPPVAARPMLLFCRYASRQSSNAHSTFGALFSPPAFTTQVCDAYADRPPPHTRLCDSATASRVS
jgi:hypothetical protein